MSQNLKTITKVIGKTILILVVTNLVFLGVRLAQEGIATDWSIGFKNGTFILNESYVGLELSKTSAKLVMLVIFVSLMAKEYKKGNWSFKRPEN